MRKVVVEAARYDRILEFEHEQIVRPQAFHLSAAVDCICRYATSASRAFYRAIEELERLQADRKAHEETAASIDAEPAKRPAELNEGQPEKQGENPASSDSRAFEDPQDGVAKVEAA